MSGFGGHWTVRRSADHDRAWAAFIKSVREHGATIREALDAIQVVFGLDAMRECKRRIEDLIGDQGGTDNG